MMQLVFKNRKQQQLEKPKSLESQLKRKEKRCKVYPLSVRQERLMRLVLLVVAQDDMVNSQAVEVECAEVEKEIQ